MSKNNSFYHLQLSVDVALIDKAVQDVEYRVDVPDLRALLQHLDLRLALLAQLGAELRERLELVDELVDDLPQPLVGQLEGHRSLGAYGSRKRVFSARLKNRSCCSSYVFIFA